MKLKWELSKPLFCEESHTSLLSQHIFKLFVFAFFSPGNRHELLNLDPNLQKTCNVTLGEIMLPKVHGPRTEFQQKSCVSYLLLQHCFLHITFHGQWLFLSERSPFNEKTTFFTKFTRNFFSWNRLTVLNFFCLSDF